VPLVTAIVTAFPSVASVVVWVSVWDSVACREVASSAPAAHRLDPSPVPFPCSQFPRGASLRNIVNCRELPTGFALGAPVRIVRVDLDGSNIARHMEIVEDLVAFARLDPHWVVFRRDLTFPETIPRHLALPLWERVFVGSIGLQHDFWHRLELLDPHESFLEFQADPTSVSDRHAYV